MLQDQLSFLEPLEKEDVLDGKYNLNIKAPIYEPKNKQPFIHELYDFRKTKKLIENIRNSNVSNEEKRFLMLAAQRHTIFIFDKIADYYSRASKEMQELIEESALVIIDFEKAIEQGFVKLSDEIAEQYLRDVDDEQE